MKKVRFELKIYKLCEASTVSIMGLKYISQDKIDQNDSASENVMIELSKSIIKKGYILFLDNWYFSLNLFLKLHQKNTNIIEIVRKNRKNMLKDIQNIFKKEEYV